MRLGNMADFLICARIFYKRRINHYTCIHVQKYDKQDQKGGVLRKSNKDDRSSNGQVLHPDFIYRHAINL
jgi:hypothetical protein